MPDGPGACAMQSRADWTEVLLLLTTEQALAVLQLSSVLHGLEYTGILGPGLQRYYKYSLREKPGSIGSMRKAYFLDSPEQRQLLQVRPYWTLLDPPESSCSWAE